MNYNRVILGGYLTRDVELRYSPRGTPVAGFGIATNRRWKTETGEVRDEVCFIDVTAFGKTAETLSKHVHKGDPLLLEGRLHLEVWTDKQTQQPRQKLKVILETFSFVAAKKDGAPARPASRPAAAPAPGGNGVDEPPPEDDSIPF